MTEQDAIEIRAINALLETGYTFEVPLKIEPKSPPKILLLWNKIFPLLTIKWRDRRIPKSWKVALYEMVAPETDKKKIIYVRQLRIKPAYLGTIDATRILYLTIDFDETRLQENPLVEAKRLFKYTNTMAEIAAIATLNKGEMNSSTYEDELKELKAFYVSHLTPALLLNLVNIIRVMSNDADFANSIRLIHVPEMTKPKAANLIE